MFALIFPLILLCMNSVKKSLLSIIFCPIIIMDICFWFFIQTAFQLVDDWILKPFIDAPPKKIESCYDEEIRRGNIFIDKLMGYWQKRSIAINEPFKFEILGLVFEAGINSCLATVAPSFTREGDSLLKKENRRILIKARLNEGDIVIEGPILLSFLNFKKMMNSYIRIYRITAYVEFDFDRRTMKNGKLIDVDIEDIKYFFVYFRGGRLLHHVMSVAASRLLSLNYYLARNVLQTYVVKYLLANFDSFEFFVDNFDPASGGSSSESEATLTSSEISDHEFNNLMTEESSD